MMNLPNLTFRNITRILYPVRCLVPNSVNRRLLHSSIQILAQSTELKPNIEHVSETMEWANQVYPLIRPSPSTTILSPDKSTTKDMKNVCDDIELKESTFFEKQLIHELGMERFQAKQLYFLYKNILNEHYPNQESIAKLCKLLGSHFDSDDLYYNPSVLKLQFNVLSNKTSILKELGFEKIQLLYLDFVSDFLHMNTDQLKTYSNSSQNIFDNMCKCLNIVDNDKKSLWNYIETNYDKIDSMLLSELRIVCIAKYFTVHLKNVVFGRIYQVCKRHERILAETSLNTVRMTVDCLHNDFKISSNRLIHNGMFLYVDFENLKKISTQLEQMTGKNTFKNIIKSPPVLKTKFSHIAYNYELIKSKCNGKFYNRSIELLSMKPSSLKSLFNEIETNSDLKVLNLDKFGKDFLIMNRHVILERIESLKQEQIPLKYIPLSFLQDLDSEFKEMLVDFTSDPDLRVRFYLENHFNLNYDEIRHRLRIVPNLSTEKYSHLNAAKIIEFLISMNVEKDKIIDSIYLILFDYKRVKSAYFNACNRYDKTLHNDPNFFKHIFDYLLLSK